MKMILSRNGRAGGKHDDYDYDFTASPQERITHALRDGRWRRRDVAFTHNKPARFATTATHICRRNDLMLLMAFFRQSARLICKRAPNISYTTRLCFDEGPTARHDDTRAIWRATPASLPA